MKRKLTDVEKRICNNQIKKLIHNKQHSEYLIKYHDLMISEGLFRNYQSKLEEFIQNKKELCAEAKSISLNIIELKKQVADGVEVKEKKIPLGVG